MKKENLNNNYILDGHIHIREGKVDQTGLIKKLDSCNITGGLLISLPPSQKEKSGCSDLAFTERLDNLFEWTDGINDLYPFFWVDVFSANAKKTNRRRMRERRVWL